MRTKGFIVFIMALMLCHGLSLSGSNLQLPCNWPISRSHWSRKAHVIKSAAVTLRVALFSDLNTNSARLQTQPVTPAPNWPNNYIEIGSLYNKDSVLYKCLYWTNDILHSAINTSYVNLTVALISYYIIIETQLSIQHVMRL